LSVSGDFPSSLSPSPFSFSLAHLLFIFLLSFFHTLLLPIHTFLELLFSLRALAFSFSIPFSSLRLNEKEERRRRQIAMQERMAREEEEQRRRDQARAEQRRERGDRPRSNYEA